jgi:hypothetical protein
MKKRNNHILSISKQIAAYLMVLLFFSMPVLQLAHTHAQPTDYSQSADGKPVLEKSSELCKLCDFLLHKQGKEIHSNHLTECAVPLVQPVELRTHLIAGNYTFTLQGFTNKGPPISANA